jgi:NADPH:quinone reductase-like Zn-dependent oxidoreductase
MRAYEVVEAKGLDGLVLNANRAEPKPGHGQIVMKLCAAALNYRDQGVVKGAYGYTKFPVIPLSDGAGEVVGIGPGVTRFKVGDRVTSTFFVNWTSGRIPPDASKNSLGGMVDGVLAEHVLLAETGAIHMPDNLTFEEAATLPCAALTAWHALVEVGRIKPGESVAILGTGGVSSFAIAFAKMQGAFVFLTSSSDEKLSRGKTLGADVLVNYKSTPEWDAEILKQSGGSGVDHVLEVGGAGTMERSIAGPGSINPRMINRKSLNLRGIHVGSREMFAAMNRAIMQTKFKPAIDKVFAFNDAKAAYAYQRNGAHFGKVVISAA